MDDARGDSSAPADAALLARLRGGDSAAFEELWVRHIGAALRRARRLAPLAPEDLAAEAFTRVFQQVATTDAGPSAEFRPYLFTVMRNIAWRWQRDARLVALEPNPVELATAADAQPIHEEAEDYATLLRAFRALPDRWQQVLWLSGVEGRTRGEVARQLDLKPNAVSALQRRARRGLRERLLWEHIPKGFRNDAAHAARLLPAVLAGSATSAQRVAVEAHLTQCAACQEIRAQLNAIANRTGGLALSAMGFGALTISMRALFDATGSSSSSVASSLAPGTAGAATVGAAAAAGGASIGGLGVKVMIAAAAVALVANIAVPVLTIGEHATPQVRETPTRVVQGHPSAPTPAPAEGTSERLADVQPSESSNPEDDYPFIDLWYSDQEPGNRAPTSGSMPPTPADPTKIPAPSPVDGPVAAPSIEVVPTADGYIAPELRGRANADAMVAVQLDEVLFEVPADAQGAWSFDLGAVELAYGDHVARLWQHSSEGTSPYVETSFTVKAPILDGFLVLGSLDASVARATGLVFTVVGPPDGTVCLEADTGQRIEIPLDGSGSAARRIRFLTSGEYVLRVAICAAERRGTATTSLIDVQSGGFGVFDIAEREIAVSEP